MRIRSVAIYGVKAFGHSWKSFVAIVLVPMCLFGVAGCSRGIAQTTVKLHTPAVAYLGSWGVKGDAPGQLKDPTGIATDSFGDVYIADAGNQYIEKFSAKGTPLLSFQQAGLNDPDSIAVDSGGGIYVTDPARSSVFVFFPEGDRYRELRLRTKPSSENELSVSIGGDGRVHVLDADARKVFNFTAPPFRIAPSWIVPADSPDSNARSGPIVASPDGYIYIADPAANRILRFTDAGHLVSEIDLSPDGAGDRFSGVFAVLGSYIFAVSADGHTLHILAIDGHERTSADLSPQLDQVGGAVSALAVSSQRRLFVLDGPESQILSFQINY